MAFTSTSRTSCTRSLSSLSSLSAVSSVVRPIEPIAACATGFSWTRSRSSDAALRRSSASTPSEMRSRRGSVPPSSMSSLSPLPKTMLFATAPPAAPTFRTAPPTPWRRRRRRRRRRRDRTRVSCRGRREGASSFSGDRARDTAREGGASRERGERGEARGRRRE